MWTDFGIIIALTYIYRIIILRNRRKLKLKRKIILVSRLALVSSFLFAGEVNNTKTSTTNNSILEDKYIDNLLQELDNEYKNILLVSDTTNLLDKCYLKLKDTSYTIFMTNNMKQNTNEGLHKRKDISKLKLNKEMIIDFYFMIQADKIINDNNSAFSNICKKISYS